MPQATLQIADIKGLTPAIRAVNQQGAFVLSGRNFTFDSLGPKSAFGCTCAVSPQLPLSMRRGFQIVRVADRLLACTNAGVFLLDATRSTFDPLWIFEEFTNVSRWTAAFINNVIYLCHSSVGILFWDLRNQARGLLDVPGLPSAPQMIVENNGRLVVMDDRLLTWSGPSNGFDFIPQQGGAGFQVIGDRIGGTPVALTSYSLGTLTWTTQGMMRSEFTGDIAVYRHRGVNTEYRPVNNLTAVKLDDETSVILDPRGLFASRGAQPEPFAPLFNEFLIEELKRQDFLVGTNLRMEYDPFSRRIYISREFAFQGDLYDQAFVLYVPLDKWGTFDFQHYGIGRGFWLDSQGLLKQFTGGASVGTPNPDSSSHLYLREREYNIHVFRGRTNAVVASTLRLSSLPESQSQTFSTQGYYNFDGSALVPQARQQLDSTIVVGHARFNDEGTGDRLAELQQLIVGSVESRELSASDVDYNVVPDGTSDEDFNVAVGAEDFGLNPQTFVNFSLRCIGSLDGVTIYQTATPKLAKFTQAMRYYSGSVLGLFHSFELKTVLPGDFYHLQFLQADGIDAGRLM